LTGGNDATLSAGDVVNGGAGTDTLNIIGAANLQNVDAAEVAVEKLFMTNTGVALDGGNNGPVDVTGVEDLQEAWVKKGSGDIDVALNLGVTAGLEGSIDDAVAFEYDGATSTTDAATLAANGADTTDGGVTVNAIESLTLAATGTNMLGTLTANNATSLTAQGEGSLNFAFEDGGADALKTVDASALEGGISINTRDTATDLSFTGGAGDDTLTTERASFTSDDSFAAGEGVDTLLFNDDADVESDGTPADGYALINGVTGFEKLGVTGTGDLDVDASEVDINTFVFNSTGDATLTGSSSEDSIELGAVTANDVTITNQVGETDTAISLTGSAANISKIDGILTANDASSVSIVSEGSDSNVNGNVIDDLDVEANTVVDISGAKDLTFTNSIGLIAGTTGVKVDAADFTGDLSVATTAQDDQDDIIIGGAGDDSLTGGAGDDTITGGEGEDTFNFASVFDTDASADDGVDTIQGFAAGDTIAFTNGNAPATLAITDSTTVVDNGIAVEFDSNSGETTLTVDLETDAGNSATTMEIKLVGQFEADDFAYSNGELTLA
jgi:hypothetical protein